MTSVRFPLSPRPPAIVAHRGSWSEHRENTMAAFAAALDESADMVELDVWLSSDGVPVVHHDELVADGTELRPVTSFTHRELATNPYTAHISALSDVFAWANGKIGVYVELKGPRTSEPVARLVREHQMQTQVVLGSFRPDLVAAVVAADADVATSILFHSTDVAAAITLGRDLGVSYLHPCWKRVSDHPSEYLSQEAVDAARGAGFGLVTWDEDRPTELVALLSRVGIDAISTNRPAPLAQLRASSWQP